MALTRQCREAARSLLPGTGGADYRLESYVGDYTPAAGFSLISSFLVVG